jgi:hypothetical protein
VTLEEDIEWGDHVFKAGSFARGGANTRISRVLFGRTIGSGPRHEFGLGAGLHWLELGAFIEGQVDRGDNSTQALRTSVSADLPLPNLGAWYMYSLAPNWLLHARVDWLSASVGDYSGAFWNTQVGIQWAVFRNIGIGLYHNGLLLDLDIDRRDWRGRFETTQQGPFFAITASW